MPGRRRCAACRRSGRPSSIMDLGLPPDPDGVSEGFATLEEVLRIAPQTKVIVVTGNGERKNALKAVSIGAYDFCEKPVEIEVLRTIVDRGLQPASAGGGEPPPGRDAGPLADRADHHRATRRC